MTAVNLAARLAQVTAHGQRHGVAGFDGNDVMVVKVVGEFTWHNTGDPATAAARPWL